MGQSQGRREGQQIVTEDFHRFFFFLPFPVFWAEMLQILNFSPIFISPLCFRSSCSVKILLSPHFGAVGAMGHGAQGNYPHQILADELNDLFFEAHCYACV